MAIVAVCVTVFVVFGLIASEGKKPRDYLAILRTAGGPTQMNARWQAAFQLSKILQSQPDLAQSDPKFVDEVITAFKDAESDDPRVRRYLAVALGALRDPRAVPSLREALDHGADSETQIYSLWALGVITDPATLPDIRARLSSEDAGMRKAAAHALGAFASPEAREALAHALADPVEDVRWNAAIALARSGDVRAAPVLIQMLDRRHLDGVRVTRKDGDEALSPTQKEEAILQAVTAAAVLPDPALKAALADLRDHDPSLKVREAARVAQLRPR